MKVLVQGTMSKDCISRVPDDVIIDILDRLPIEDAVRTGILSTNWRYKWHMLTKLRFELGCKVKHSYEGRNISKVLLNLICPVTKFVLDVKHNKISDVEDISSWVLFLSRKGISDFTLFNYYETLELPSHLFLCLELERLSQYKCSFHLPSSFRGFPNLLRFELSHVVFKSGSCGEFISRCPLLESLKILGFQIIGEIKGAEIAKLENLRALSLPLCVLDNMTTITTASRIFQLMALFPKLQELDLDFRTCKFLEDAIKIDPVALPCLKFVHLNGIDFISGIMVSYAIELICSSPNLKTLRITGTCSNQNAQPAICSLEADKDSRVVHLKLETVWLGCIRG